MAAASGAPPQRRQLRITRKCLGSLHGYGREEKVTAVAECRLPLACQTKLG